ncbi:hypothetical protein [Actimicrobium sp. CCI2.3]|uniref:hypothetical protein n=1 Tax=Actimicrobium sp. CCI2.3 TaxID=3048616 RepID=UPI002AB42DC2|nr:hypothetical protein [Actimicrobium sp. CCI2.3]MDY7576604.1 hypothetical protein [Actimicrobium sp. CCI2.3]MEB0021205.1 hypothetical protein [Actimicrobium sp. CCI2.3]
MQNPAGKAEPGFFRAALAVFVWACAVVVRAWRPQAGFDFLDQIGAEKLYVKAANGKSRQKKARNGGGLESISKRRDMEETGGV